MPRPDINVTPLIDVLLVLLIIFMLVTPTKFSQMESRIPSEPADTKDVDNHPLTLIVGINKDRSLALNNAATDSTVSSTDALISRLKQIFRKRTANEVYAQNSDPAEKRIEKAVFIQAPKDINYGDVSKVVDAVRMAGASPVSLQIDNLK